LSKRVFKIIKKYYYKETDPVSILYQQGQLHTSGCSRAAGCGQPQLLEAATTGATSFKPFLKGI